MKLGEWNLLRIDRIKEFGEDDLDHIGKIIYKWEEKSGKIFYEIYN